MPADRLLHPKQGHSAKVSKLKDFEFRVWVQYILSADDFGVMRATAAKIKADSDALDCRSTKIIEAAIGRLLKSGLVSEFEHQGRTYVFQPTWQDFQKVTYPAKTIHPMPPTEALEKCTPATRHLFTVHPGGRKLEKNSRSTSEVVQENSESSSEELLSRAKRLTLTANGDGQRLTANGSESEASIDVMAQRLMSAYPPQGSCSIHDATAALRDVLHGKPASEFEALLVRLESHKRSAKWTDQSGRFIPRLDRYLRSGTHTQVMPPREDAQPIDSKLPEWLRKVQAAKRAGAAS